MNKCMKGLFLLIMVGFLFLLNACGGGGGGSSTGGTTNNASGGDGYTGDTTNNTNNSDVKAVIEAPKVVNKQSTVVLDGSKSVNAKIFEWTVLEGPLYKLEDSNKPVAKFIPISEGIYKIQLKVSDGNKEDVASIEIESKPISSIVITSPASNENYVTTNSEISLEGYISGHIVSVKAINLATNNEYQAIITDNQFAIENIELQQGDNLIKVIGIDSIGEEFEDNLTVTYNPEVEFLSSLVLKPDVVFVNETTSVIVRVAISKNSNISEVKLFKLDENNNPIEEIVALYDNGDVDNGDDIAGDGVYSAKFTINATEEGTIRYRVIVDDKAYSNIASLEIISHITDEQIATAKQVITNALNTLPETPLSEDEVDQAIDNLIYTLKNDPNVSKVHVSPAKDFIEIITKDGIPMGITFSYVYVDNKTEVHTKRGVNLLSGSNDFQKIFLHYYKKSINSIKLKSTKSFANKSSNDNAYVGNYNVIYLEPMAFDIGTFNRNIFKDYPEFTVTYLENYDVTVETFKNLEKYGVIIISSHGGGGFAFLTGQKATDELIKQYAKDIIKRRLKIYNKVVLVKDAGGFWIFKWDKEQEADVFAITFNFIEHYYQNKKLPDSLVFLGICEGLETNKLANAFISAGAKTVVGYTNEVYVDYDNGIFEIFFDSLLTGKIVEEAVNEARNVMGEHDEIWYENTYGKKPKKYTPARFEFRGEGKLKIFKEMILNGGFEDNLKYWEGEGDVRTISVLGPLSPPEGNYMLIISTGLGSINDSNSYVLQKFEVPLDATTLSFVYNVVSEEPMEWVNTVFDDKFQASIIDEEGNEEVIAIETVNTSEWHLISGINFHGGDNTTYHTDWKSIDFDISKYRGRTITIKFHVWDKGDSLWDTAVLIDDVRVQ